jgi:hypothetical protein
MSVLREADPPARSGSADNTHHLDVCCAVDPRLESLQNHAVGTFHLPIRHGVSHGSAVHPDMVILTEVQEILAGELVPLSVMMEFGTPKRWMMLVKNATA